MYYNATELWQDRLEAMLAEDLEKEGVDTNPETSTDSKDESRSTVGTTALYDNPEDRSSGDIDAPWGEPGPDDPSHNSSGVWNKHVETKHELLGKAFSGTKPAFAADQQLISANFAHGASGNFESHAPSLHAKSKTKATKEPTLMEKVRTVAGRH